MAGGIGMVHVTVDESLGHLHGLLGHHDHCIGGGIVVWVCQRWGGVGCVWCWEVALQVLGGPVDGFSVTFIHVNVNG